MTVEALAENLLKPNIASRRLLLLDDTFNTIYELSEPYEPYTPLETFGGTYEA